LVGVAVNVTLVPEQIVVAEAEIEIVGVTGVVTDIVMTLLVAVVPFTHGALLVTTQLTVLPAASDALLYVELFVPTGDPLRYHWKSGELPPLAGEAVNVTFVPPQMLLPWFEVIETVGAALLFTVIRMPVLLATAGLAQPRLLVIWTDTMFPLVSADVVNVGLLFPTGVPVINHW
jgi:hypothetical protein